MATYFSLLICERNNARGCVSCTKYEWKPFSIAKLPEVELEISEIVLLIVRMKLLGYPSTAVSGKKQFKFPTCSFPFSACPSKARSLWMYHECVTSDALWLFKQAPVTAKDAVWNLASADSRVRKHSWKELILYKQAHYRPFLIKWQSASQKLLEFLLHLTSSPQTPLLK